jgi:hypothetical protein
MSRERNKRAYLISLPFKKGTATPATHLPPKLYLKVETKAVILTALQKNANELHLLVL